MGKVHAAIDVRATPEEAQDLWLDPTRWPSFIDGFGHVAGTRGDWPAPGSSITWDSRPGGRGRVLDIVDHHAPGEQTTLTEEDERTTATQRATFIELDGGCRVQVQLDYRVKPGKGVPAVVDVLFVRRAMRDALRRTLTRFAAELS